LVTKTTITSTKQSLKKGKEHSIGRFHHNQYNDTHSTRTISDEKWRIMIPHDMTDCIFNHLYRHHMATLKSSKRQSQSVVSSIGGI
jgi:hypothetical protein